MDIFIQINNERNMFEFFKHKNVAEKEEEVVTVNTAEQVVDSTIETGGDTNADLFYKSPEYKEAVEVYELVGPEDFFIGLQKELATDANELYEDDWSDSMETTDDVDSSEIITEVQPEFAVVNEFTAEGGLDVGDNEDNSSNKVVSIGQKVLSASAALSFGLLAACDKVKEYYPEWIGNPAQSETVPAKPNVKTEPEAVPNQQEVKPKPETASTQLEKVQVVVKKTSGENMESTLPTKKGVAEVFEQYSKEILPSGDPRYGYITLNEATVKAAAKGGLKNFSELKVYALEVSEDPAKQGIPYKSIWILKLSENKIPRPLIKGENASFKGYISRNKNGVYYVTPEKLNTYKRDLANNVPEFKNAKGITNQVKHDKLVKQTEDFGTSQLNTLLEWQNANPAGRAALLEKWVKPYQKRTGTIKDGKGKK